MVGAADDDFFRELETLEVKIPGGQRFPFNDETLMRLFLVQLPNWKHDGQISWIPTNSDPRLRRGQTQVSKERQKRDSRFQLKRENDISKLHKLLVGMAGRNQNGIAVFPNISTREVFKTSMAKVDMDLVLAHSTKGLFVFNVYSQSVTEMTATKIQTNCKEHFNFVRALLKYRQEDTNDEVPIHTVVCLPRYDSKEKLILLEKEPRGRSRTLIFRKSQLKRGIFSSVWRRKLKELPDLIDRGSKSMLDISVARLSFLSLISQSFHLLNDKQVSSRSNILWKVLTRFFF